MTGTGLAQAIPIAVSPLLTRLYEPEDFGIFGLYMAVASIAAVVITGRYELAILLPRRDRDALHIVALAAGLSLVLSFGLLLLILIFQQALIGLFENQELVTWLYWVPASTFFTGVYQSCSYWCNRKALYKRIAVNKTIQSGNASVTQLGGGYMGAGFSGLVAGQLLGQAVSLVGLARGIWREHRLELGRLNQKRMVLLAKKYVNFPKYLIVAHGFNTAAGQLPVLLTNGLFGASVAGFYTLTQRVLGAPMSLVASAVGDVFRQEASESYIQNGECLSLYKRTFLRLLYISLAPFLVFFLLAPSLFAWVFGESWRVAGEYAMILTPMYFMQFVTSPLSAMFVIAQKQKLDLLWQVSLVVSTSIAFVSGFLLGHVVWALVLFSACYSVMYAINGYMTYGFAKGRGRMHG